MRIPPNLVSGDKVALVAPSFGCTTEPYLTRLGAAAKMWRKKGYIVVEGNNVHREDGPAASAPAAERAEEFMEAYASDAKLILSVGGGETMCEILPYIDFDRLAKLPPKWFMGFSDNTNLTLPLTIHCDVATIYGPCMPSFFQKEWRLSELDAYRMLQGETHFEGYPKWSITRKNPDHPLWGYRLSQPKIITPYQYEGPMHGVFLGGCLDCLAHICGTKYDKVKEFNARHKEGIIWYLEACDLHALALRLTLFTLKEAGWFDNASGFLLGRMLSAREEFIGIDRFKAAIDILGPLGKPILMDIDLGHIPPSMPILNGVTGTAKLEKGNIIIDYDR